MSADGSKPEKYKECMKMNFEEFCKEMMGTITERAEEGATVKLHEVPKNNGIILHGLSLAGKTENISATVYLDPLYQEYLDGVSLSKIADRIEETFARNRVKAATDLSFFTSFEKAKDKILFKLINFEKNREMLADMPYKKMYDLALVFYCLVNEVIEGGVIMIHNKHTELWGVGAEELFEIAVQNTPSKCPPILFSLENAVTSGMQSEDDKTDLPDTIEGMQVLSNREKVFGACTIFYPGMLRKISEIMGSGFYILPSSVHELILMPDTDDTCDGEVSKSLKNIVRDVNSTTLDEEDILSDSVYYYDKNADTMRLEAV